MCSATFVMRSPLRAKERQVEELLQLPMDPNYQLFYAGTLQSPLGEAAKRGLLEIVQTLVEAGARSQGSETLTSLAEMAFSTDRTFTPERLEIVSLLWQTNEEAIKMRDLLAGLSLRVPLSADGMQMLHFAAQLCLKAGRAEFYPALLSVAIAKRHVNTVRHLLDAGVDANCTDLDGKPQLLAAAELGHLEIVRLLLQAGASKNLSGTAGDLTPLALAREKGYEEIVRLLAEDDLGDQRP